MGGTRKTFAAAAALLAAVAITAHAAPRLDDVVVSEERDGAESAIVAPTAEAVFVSGNLGEVPAGAMLRSEWIAFNVDGVPLGHRIDAAQVRVAEDVKGFRFSLSRPDDGWPVGDYRVDLFIDGRLASVARFSVAE